MQDDQLPPRSCTWLKYTLRQFARWPRLGAIGFRNAHMFHPQTLLDNEFQRNYTRDKQGVGQEGQGQGGDGLWGRCKYGMRYTEEGIFRRGRSGAG